MDSSLVLSWDELTSLRDQWRQEGQTVVWSNGCFDILHIGHVRTLTAAKAFGDRLVVGINSDASVRKLKGPERPVVSEQDRAELIASLRCVDAVVIFSEETPEASLQRLQPEIHCKGAEYQPPHGKPIPEAELVTRYGGKICFLPMIPDHSTTSIIHKIQETS